MCVKFGIQENPAHFPIPTIVLAVISTALSPQPAIPGGRDQSHAPNLRSSGTMTMDQSTTKKETWTFGAIANQGVVSRLGTLILSKMDEFLERLQTAFDPLIPALILEFFQKSMIKFNQI